MISRPHYAFEGKKISLLYLTVRVSHSVVRWLQFSHCQIRNTKPVLGSHNRSTLHLSKCCCVAITVWCSRVAVCLHNNLSLISLSVPACFYGPWEKKKYARSQMSFTIFWSGCVALNQSTIMSSSVQICIDSQKWHSLCSKTTHST